MVAYDSVGPAGGGGAGSTGSTTATWAHVVAAGPALIVAGINVDVNGSGNTFSAGITCGGTAMTAVGARVYAVSTATNGGWLQLFWIAAQGTGSHTILATVTGGTPGNLSGGSVAFTGAGNVGTQAAGQGTSANGGVTVPSTTSGNMVAGFIAAGDTVPGFSAGTVRYTQSQNQANDTGSSGAATAPSTGSAVSITSTIAASGDTWAAIGAEILAGGGGGGGPVALPYTGGQYYRRKQRGRRQRMPLSPAAAPAAVPYPVILGSSFTAVQDSANW